MGLKLNKEVEGESAQLPGSWLACRLGGGMKEGVWQHPGAEAHGKYSLLITRVMPAITLQGVLTTCHPLSFLIIVSIITNI